MSYVRSVPSSETLPRFTGHASFLNINISQDNVTARSRFCGIFNDSFIANLPESIAVKEFVKSMNIW